MTKKIKPGHTKPIDPGTLYITDEPFVGGRSVQGSKYDDIFARLPKNQRLVCATGQAARLSQGLRKWLERRGHPNAVVRSKECCDDGKGGVWWLDGERADRSRRAKSTLASAASGNPFAILSQKRKP